MCCVWIVFFRINMVFKKKGLESMVIKIFKNEYILILIYVIWYKDIWF